MSMPMGIERKIKDLIYYDYGALVAVEYRLLEHALGSDNKILLEALNTNVNTNGHVSLCFECIEDKPKSLWFTERQLLAFLYKAGYVTEKEIFVKSL